MTTKRKLALNELPAWPGRLDREGAAAYLGVSTNHFDQYNRPFLKEIKEGSRVLFLFRQLELMVLRGAESGGKLDALNRL
jgi:hypothetical protein